MAKKKTRARSSRVAKPAARRNAAKPPKRAVASSKKPTATSLHIGLNAVDPAALRGMERPARRLRVRRQRHGRRSPQRRASSRPCC